MGDRDTQQNSYFSITNNDGGELEHRSKNKVHNNLTISLRTQFIMRLDGWTAVGNSARRLRDGRNSLVNDFQLDELKVRIEKTGDKSLPTGEGGSLASKRRLGPRGRRRPERAGAAQLRSSRRARAARATGAAPRRCARGRRPPRAPPSCRGWPRPAPRTRGRCWCSLSQTSPWTGCRARGRSVPNQYLSSLHCISS